jgi:lipopolysaccharide/colanic/teichoic acid biosynthesis glycosyltransferase
MSSPVIDRHASSPSKDLEAQAPAARRANGRLVDASCRALDVAGAAAMLIILAPVLVAIAARCSFASDGSGVTASRLRSTSSAPCTTA